MQTSTNPITLAPSEEIINVYDYQHMHAKQFDRTDSLILTNKRVIGKSSQKIKAVETKVSYEVPISDISSIESFLSSQRKPLNPFILVLCLVFIGWGALMLFLSLAFEEEVPQIISLCLFGLCALILLIALFCRKKQHIFMLDINRISYEQTNEHVNLKDSTLSPQQSKRIKKVRSIINVLEAVLLIIAMIASAIFTPKNNGNWIPILINFTFFILMLALVMPFTIKTIRRRKNKNYFLYGAPILQRVKVDIDAEVVRTLIDELGAKIFDLQQATTQIEELSTQSEAQTEQSI